MYRRTILLGLAAATAGPALAQTNAPAASGGVVPTPSGPMPGGGGQTAAAGMGPAEMEHARRTAMVGMVALETSNIALQKAQNAKVKEFAQFEHDEQTLVAEVLKSMGHQPQPMDPKMAEMVQKLKGMQAGAAFDKEYVAAQTDGHQMLLQIQEDYLKTGKMREHVNVAKLVRGVVKEHLAHLADLKKAAS